MGNSNASSRWISVCAEDLAWTSLGEEFAVYHRASGLTHLLNQSSAALVAETLDRPMTAAEIAAALELNLTEGEDLSSQHELVMTLDFLVELGLLKRCP